MSTSKLLSDSVNAQFCVKRKESKNKEEKSSCHKAVKPG